MRVKDTAREMLIVPVKNGVVVTPAPGFHEARNDSDGHVFTSVIEFLDFVRESFVDDAEE